MMMIESNNPAVATAVNLARDSGMSREDQLEMAIVALDAAYRDTCDRFKAYIETHGTIAVAPIPADDALARLMAAADAMRAMIPKQRTLRIDYDLHTIKRIEGAEEIYDRVRAAIAAMQEEKP